jgi:hypothetical protein
MAETLPQRSAAARAAAAEVAAGLADVTAAAAAADAAVEALAAPVAEARGEIAAAASLLDQQRQSIASAGEALVVELNQARLLLGAVEQEAGSSALAAATRLVDAMAQVHDVAAGTAATVRSALDAVIDEARAALAAMSAEVMQQSFTAPIAAKARETEAAAAAAAEVSRAAAERSAAALAALATTLARLDRHASDRMEELAADSRRRLQADAGLLTDRLAAHASALSAALDKPMDNADWKAWRAGERGLFHRRALALLGRREAREIGALLKADAGLMATAQRFTAEFAALVDRIDPAGDSPLALALRSSEPGRLAALLEEALAA